MLRRHKVVLTSSNRIPTNLSRWQTFIKIEFEQLLDRPSWVKGAPWCKPPQPSLVRAAKVCSSRVNKFSSRDNSSSTAASSSSSSCRARTRTSSKPTFVLRTNSNSRDSLCLRTSLLSRTNFLLRTNFLHSPNLLKISLVSSQAGESLTLLWTVSPGCLPPSPLGGEGGGRQRRCMVRWVR